jgi:hypothetical protein
LIRQIGIRGSTVLNDYIKTFSVSYTTPSNPNFVNILSGSSTKIFTGNSDANTEKLNDINLLISEIKIVTLTTSVMYWPFKLGKNK